MNNINSGKWKPGQKILSEADIAKYNHVSRNTVREAIIPLVNSGILYQKKGSGTYVNTDISPKKHIIILYENFFFKDIIGASYRHIIKKIKEKFEEINYIPLLVECGKETEYLNIKINRISAIIKMTQIASNLDCIATQNNIPVIEYGDNNTPFASVKEDTLLQFAYLNQLIQKYNLKDILIFSKNYTNMEYLGSFFYILYNDYFQKKGYNVCLINESPDLPDTEKIIYKALQSIDHIPHAIMFLDDNVYKCGYEIYPLFDSLLKQTKIITFSNKNEIYNPKYKTCKIAFDLDKIAEKIYDLTFENIKKENKTVKNIIIKPEIIDEDKLM